ncbi:helix-turn-helix transcriptional regulator [Hydrogenophaga sp. A37]|uniref:helix-turn-helix transcriptional regulator n=1 Tax=Hydrogenophaga sp. A37 TaxID=1945864 RepID=UPI0009D08168|nr:helix-turn-helix domain-containing protein [Hydrogenophaga sp. A37]OOG82758.1 hypothetical protein B0E41_14100 [Hydrogenophaga sp. A37]
MRQNSCIKVRHGFVDSDVVGLSGEKRGVDRPTWQRTESMGEPQFIRLSQLLELLPVSASSVWRWVRSGRIRAIKLGPRITVFSREEVMEVFFSEAAL